MTRTRRALAAVVAGAGLAVACDRGAKPAPAPPAVVLPTTGAPSSDAPPDGAIADSAIADSAIADSAIADSAIADSAIADGSVADGATGCPPEMARINRYCIDKWEAHLVVPGEDGVLVPHPHSHRPEPGMIAKSEPDVFPQGYISRIEAAAACKAAGKRLCSLGEWSRACRGKRGLLYPYGGNGRPGACNSGKKHLLTELFGPSPGAWKYDETFNAPVLLETPGYLAKTGEYGGCASEDGVMDLVGNLHEWVSDGVDQALVDRMESEPIERRSQPWREGNGIFASGFFSTTKEHGPGCTFLTIAHEPRYHDYSIGFRCCRPADR